MTRDEAIGAIQKIAGQSLTDADVKGLDGCTQEQLMFIVQGWANVGKVRDRSAWSQIVDILAQVPEWVQLALKIAGAVAAVLK